MNYWLLLIPLLAAITGWLIVVYLVKSMFRAIPALQPRLARQLGEFASNEFTSAYFGTMFEDPRNFQNLKPLVETHVDDFLRKKLPIEMPMIGMFIGDKTIDTLKTIFIREVESLFPEVMSKFAGNLSESTLIGDVVTTRFASIPPEKITGQLREGLQKEVNRVCLAGLIIGLISGLVQLAILLLVL
jgi:hypothetical protein